MTEVFVKSQVAKIEPSYSCESMCAYKDKVFIGTKQGFLIVYSVEYIRQKDKSVETKGTFNFIIRDFNRKPITQIELAEEFGIFLLLSMGTIYIHKLKDYKHISSIDIRNISKFCLDIYNPDDLKNSLSKKKLSETFADRKQNEANLTSSIINDKMKPSNELRICVISKRKLIIMNWQKENNTFVATDKIFKLDCPVGVQFLCNFLCVATKYEYMLININSGDMKPLFNVGKSQDPFITRISDLVALKIDNTIELIDPDGNMLSTGNLRYSFVPSVLLYHPPFTISLSDKYIEVRMTNTGILIQSLLIENAHLICRNLDRLYVLSDKKLMALVGTERPKLVDTYADNEDFETALILAKTAPLVGEAEIDCGMINIRYALSLFKNQQFEKAFNIFIEITTDPSDVLVLFPSLCPEKVKKEKEEVKEGKEDMKRDKNKIKKVDLDIIENFTNDEKIEATRALIDFLVKWRVKLRKLTETVYCTSITNGKKVGKSKNMFQQIIDTSLLKCYITINSPLVAPLLRQENFCHLDETRRTLEKYEKFQELILLYENHGKHDEALQLLYSQSVKTHSPLFGRQPIINYMKNLNPHHLHLMYQYGDWILKESPLDWLNIFIHWFQREKATIKENVKYPAYKDNVLKHIQEQCPKIVIPFLESIIYEINNNEEFDLDSVDFGNQTDKDSLNGNPSVNNPRENLDNSLKYKLIHIDNTTDLPIAINPPYTVVDNLHTYYINALIDEILSLKPNLLLEMPINNVLRDSSLENKYIFELRERLKLFLQSENSKYNAEKVLSKLPYDGFYEERAVLLSRTGKHEQALTLWIYVLEDWEQAVEHCNRVYQSNKEIFFNLLNICIEPSEPTSIGIVLPNYEFTSITNNNKKSISNYVFQPRLDKALEIMKKHADKLNSSLAIKLLSHAFTINDLLPFARNSLSRQSSLLNHCLFLRNIQFYNRLLSNLKHCLSAQKSFIVDKNSKCYICQKFMGSSAFARYPDGSLVHYGCCKNLPKTK